LRNRGEGIYVGVELPDEAGEVVVLEVLGQEVPGELGRVPHHEAVVGGAPRNYRVGCRVVHHVVRLAQERRRRVRVRHRCRLRRRLRFPAAARDRRIAFVILSGHFPQNNFEYNGLENLY
jgi:hypothetical protein